MCEIMRVNERMKKCELMSEELNQYVSEYVNNLID